MEFDSNSIVPESNRIIRNKERVIFFNDVDGMNFFVNFLGRLILPTDNKSRIIPKIVGFNCQLFLSK